MARWFGYRPGYEDLCRVWLPDDVADQFRYVAGIVDELRGQLRAMKKQGLTPEDFGLMVRMHPETLKITPPRRWAAPRPRLGPSTSQAAHRDHHRRLGPENDREEHCDASIGCSGSRALGPESRLG